MTAPQPIPDAPVYRATLAEMDDLSQLLAHAAHLAQQHGAVRIDPPPEWTHPPLQMSSASRFFVRMQTLPAAPFAVAPQEPQTAARKRRRPRPHIASDVVDLDAKCDSDHVMEVSVTRLKPSPTLDHVDTPARQHPPAPIVVSPEPSTPKLANHLQPPLQPTNSDRQRISQQQRSKPRLNPQSKSESEPGLAAEQQTAPAQLTPRADVIHAHKHHAIPVQSQRAISHQPSPNAQPHISEPQQTKLVLSQKRTNVNLRLHLNTAPASTPPEPRSTINQSFLHAYQLSQKSSFSQQQGAKMAQPQASPVGQQNVQPQAAQLAHQRHLPKSQLVPQEPQASMMVQRMQPNQVAPQPNNVQQYLQTNQLPQYSPSNHCRKAQTIEQNVLEQRKLAGSSASQHLQSGVQTRQPIPRPTNSRLHLSTHQFDSRLPYPIRQFGSHPLHTPVVSLRQSDPLELARQQAAARQQLSQRIAYCLSSNQQPASLGRDPQQISQLQLQEPFGTAIDREHHPLSFQSSLAMELHAGRQLNVEFQPQLYAHKLQRERLSNATGHEQQIAGRRSIDASLYFEKGITNARQTQISAETEAPKQYTRNSSEERHGPAAQEQVLLSRTSGSSLRDHALPMSSESDQQLFGGQDLYNTAPTIALNPSNVGALTTLDNGGRCTPVRKYARMKGAKRNRQNLPKPNEAIMNVTEPILNNSASQQNNTSMVGAAKNFANDGRGSIGSILNDDTSSFPNSERSIPNISYSGLPTSFQGVDGKEQSEMQQQQDATLAQPECAGLPTLGLINSGQDGREEVSALRDPAKTPAIPSAAPSGSDIARCASEDVVKEAVKVGPGFNSSPLSQSIPEEDVPTQASMEQIVIQGRDKNACQKSCKSANSPQNRREYSLQLPALHLHLNGAVDPSQGVISSGNEVVPSGVEDARCDQNSGRLNNVVGSQLHTPDMCDVQSINAAAALLPEKPQEGLPPPPIKTDPAPSNFKKTDIAQPPLQNNQSVLGNDGCSNVEEQPCPSTANHCITPNMSTTAGHLTEATEKHDTVHPKEDTPDLKAASKEIETKSRGERAAESDANGERATPVAGTAETTSPIESNQIHIIEAAEATVNPVSASKEQRLTALKTTGVNIEGERQTIKTEDVNNESVAEVLSIDDRKAEGELLSSAPSALKREKSPGKGSKPKKARGPYKRKVNHVAHMVMEQDSIGRLTKSIVFPDSKRPISLKAYKQEALSFQESTRIAVMDANASTSGNGDVKQNGDWIEDVDELEKVFWSTLKSGLGGKSITVAYGVDVEAEGAFDSAENSYVEWKGWKYVDGSPKKGKDAPRQTRPKKFCRRPPLPKERKRKNQMAHLPSTSLNSLRQEAEARPSDAKTLSEGQRTENLDEEILEEGCGTTSIGEADKLRDKATKEPQISAIPKSHVGNLNCNGLLRHMPKMPGINHSMYYVGQLFTRFCWHVEDAFLNSVSYLHYGSANKVWYAVPPEYAEQFEEYASKNIFAPSLLDENRNSGQLLLMNKTTMFDPKAVQKSGIKVFRVVHKPGSFVLTAPRAYHAGFNCGFNIAEAVNYASPAWFPVGRDASRFGRKMAKSLCVPWEYLLFHEARSTRDDFQEKKIETMSEAGKRVLFNARLVATELERIVADGESRIRAYAQKSNCRIAMLSEIDALVKNNQLGPEFGHGAGMVCAVCGHACHFYAEMCASCEDTFEARCVEHFGQGHKMCEVPGHKSMIVRRHDPVFLYDLIGLLERIGDIEVSTEVKLSRYQSYLRSWQTPYKTSGLRLRMNLKAAMCRMAPAIGGRKTKGNFSTDRGTTRRYKPRKRSEGGKRRRITEDGRAEGAKKKRSAVNEVEVVAKEDEESLGADLKNVDSFRTSSGESLE